MPAPPSSGRRPKVDGEATVQGVDQYQPENAVAKMLPVQVVAQRAGFYGNVRRSVGDKFMITDISRLGKWMKLV